MDDDKFQRESPRRARRFQFSLLTIFIIFTVCAAVAALIRTIPLPEFVRYGAAVYLMILGIPLFLRLPSLIRTWRTYSARMRQLDEQRERLLDSARRRQRERCDESGKGEMIED